MHIKSNSSTKTKARTLSSLNNKFENIKRSEILNIYSVAHIQEKRERFRFAWMREVQCSEAKKDHCVVMRVNRCGFFCGNTVARIVFGNQRHSDDIVFR